MTKVEDTIRAIKEEITHKYDGPVTRFVMISRAMKMAQNQEHDYSLISEATDDLFDDFDFAEDESSGYNTADGQT